MAAREEQSKKVALPIVVTLSGIVMAAREEHPEKALSPIVVTPSGMVMAMREEHSLKAYSPIVVTPFAKVTSVSSRSFTKLSLPEYTAVWGILGKEVDRKSPTGLAGKVVVLTRGSVTGRSTRTNRSTRCIYAIKLEERCRGGD